MITSWLTFFLPKDEYKRLKTIYFMAEAAVTSMILFGAIAFIELLSIWHFDANILWGLGFCTPLLYIATRYMLSGMEYENVVTARQFQRERKALIYQTFAFVVIFFILYILFMGVSTLKKQLADVIGLLITVGLVAFLSNYISLKRSYKKNRDLLD